MKQNIALDIMQDALDVATYEDNSDAVVIKIKFSKFKPEVNVLPFEFDTWGTLKSLFDTIRERSELVPGYKFIYYDKVRNVYEMYLDPEHNETLYDNGIEPSIEYKELHTLIETIGDAG